MEALKYFPFTKLKLPAGEEVLWCATNPTFHRSSEYGIALTREALYLYYVPSFLFLWFARWKRLPFSEIANVSFRDSRWRPRLKIELANRSVSFSTPYDSYTDEMDFDRKKLLEGARLANELLQPSIITANGA